ncbi:MAG: hypothetical protein ACI4LH_05455 [Candidatus Heritagella sp.]
MKKTRFNRITSLVLAVLLLVPAVSFSGPAVSAAADSDTIFLNSAEDFAELAENCTLDTWSQGKKVVLQADISLSGAAAVQIPTFGGEFDGNGHTISGVKITQSTTPSGLFGVLQESAAVKNLTVSGDIAPAGDGSCVGGIAGENYGLITGCTFTGNAAGKNSVGGVAGINGATGRILSCRTGGSVTGDKMTGGIAGCNLGTIQDCRNGAYVNTIRVDSSFSPEDISLDFSLDLSVLSSMDTSTSSSDTGGIAGYSSGLILECSNHAPVGYPHVGYNAGGIAGRSCGTLYACENSANVYGRKDVGGIAGQMEPYIAQNITESTLDKLESQLDKLDALLTTALEDANAGTGTVSSRLNRIADYLDSAAGAAGNIRTYANASGTVDGNGQTDASGGITVTPPQAQAEGDASAAGGAGVIITPGGSAGGGVIAGEGEIQAGLTEGSAQGENHTSASGNVSASAQMTLTTNLSGLTSSLSGMSGQMRLLSGEISGISGTLTEDLQAIQKQIRAISDTAMELFGGEDTGDLLIDSSESDGDSVTLGKTHSCLNSGSISGDINVGGIAGAMAMEYELDPEDDITANMDARQRRKLEVKSVISRCVNNGSVTAKRSYAGGICGRMDLGLITKSEGYGRVASENGNYVGGIAGLTSSTVRQCFAKCTLAGKKYTGGIVGSGVFEDLSGESSTVAGCYSMVSIESSQEFSGAISGGDAGTFLENYFVSDTLTGINGRSYSGKAEPISYEALLKKSGSGSEKNADETFSVPDAFLQLTLSFAAGDETIKTVSFEYGASFDGSVYPEIPEKEGYYAVWDRTDLQNLHFDTVVTAVYTPYVSALSHAEERSDGRPIFFVEGQFGEGDAVQVTSLPHTPQEFSFLTRDWTGFLAQSFSGTTVCREIVEQWRISIPDDGQKTHTIRYLAPDGSPDHLDIYVKGPDGWQKAETEIIGSYLTFSAEGTEIEAAAISTASVWWVWLIAGVLLFLLLFLLFRLIRRISRKRAASRAAARRNHAASGESPAAAPHAAPKKKRRWLTPLLILLALLVGIAGTAAFFLLPDLITGKQAYDLLKRYAEKAELDMELTVHGELDSEALDFTAMMSRTDIDGHRATAIRQGERILTYSEGTVFLENGSAYKLSDSLPDYSRLLDQALELYQYVDMEEEDGTYTITAGEEDAAALLELLFPSASSDRIEAGTVQVEMKTQGDDVSEIRFSGSGSLKDAGKTPLRVSAVLTLDPDRDRVAVPEAVRAALVSGDYSAGEPLSDDLIRLAAAWQALTRADYTGANLTLRADCGPVTLDNRLTYCRWKEDGLTIHSVQKNGCALYFTEEDLCDENGRELLLKDAGETETVKLLDLACELCLHSSMDGSAGLDSCTYTLSLDQESMEAAACAIAPEAGDMDLLFDSGTLQVVVEGDRIARVAIDCGGTARLVVSDTPVSFEAQLEFPEEMDRLSLPETVKEALQKQRGGST